MSCCRAHVAEPVTPSSASSSEQDEQQAQQNEETGPKIDNSSVLVPGFSIKGSVAHFDAGMTLCQGSVNARFSIPLSWHDLAYTANGRRILRDLTGTALPSRCLAIMGSSGAGKTTFLNAISDRLASSRTLKITGKRQLGDLEYRRRYRRMIGFVAQDDILSPRATPEDSLSFSLRVRRGTSRKETNALVEESLGELRLVHCRDTIVGIPGLIAGLSGGERKRASIGVELICDPKIIMLDEPTSGLDSVTSVKIAHLLNTIARTGRTVIYTIHQPTAETLNYFDDIMLLTEGQCAYHGTMAKSVEYFESIGYTCPERYTPTDFYMTLLQDPDTSKILIKKWKKYLKHGVRTPHTTAVELNPTPSESSTAHFIEKYLDKFRSTPWIQFEELMRRSAVELGRNRVYLFSQFVQAAFFAVIVGLIFINVKDDVTGIQDREGVIFMATMNRAMGQTFIMVNSFMADKPLYIREQMVGSYSPFMYFLSRTLVEFPVRVFFCLIESSILYWMVGLYRDAGAFFYYFGVLALLTEVASGLGFLLSASFTSLIVASATAPVILMPLALAGGLLASTDRLQPYWYWLEKPSFIRQAFILLTRNEFKHLTHIYCDGEGKSPNYCRDQPKNGEQVLQQLGFQTEQSSDWAMWVSLAVLYFLFRFFVVIALSIAARTKF
ncbi:ATP-binding cassette protein subfamily G, member 1 [Trypanosoma conorhini]|uniref:ATP-binding cassette protein subfamily G, member 1 n=1 Tax=Trypanosoma conorhini TaxID=83891 RepID=A0A422PAL1_9TRYP|nr:ATP-binding cassette protein subfamily G, member 1 [Trypanosoma conorhini]RNF14755.1 ATP-binding cassette protein subfamily G, member 1 [Trypanosoma conorhini]